MTNSAEIPFDVKILNWMGTFLYGFFILMVLLGLFIWFVMNPSSNLRGITIRGDIIHHSVSSLRSNLVPNLKGNFYTINMSSTQNVLESLPWVSTAVVKRVFPNRIEVMLLEHKAIAAWGARDGSKMVNNVGLIFDSSIDDEASESLPLFIGPDGQSNLLVDMYRHLIPILNPLNARLVQLELSARGSWSTVLEGGAVIELGRGSVDAVSERAKRFSHTLVQVTSKFNRNSSALQYADLRHSDGYAVRLNGVSTVGYPDTNSSVKKAY